MPMSSFQSHAYLWLSVQVCHLAICMDTTLPYMSTLLTPIHDWDYSLYSKVTEIIPSDIPEHLGKWWLLSHMLMQTSTMICSVENQSQEFFIS